MNVVRAGTLLLCIAVLIVLPRGSFRAAAATSLAPPAAKVCKTVKKHGKKKKVCTTVTPTPTPHAYDQEATRLADAFSSASSGDVRYHALLAILDALHYAVYTPEGKLLDHGAGTSKDPLYFDVEAQDIANRFPNASSSDLGDVANDLALAGVQDANKQAVSADTLAQALESSVTWSAAHPNDPVSLTPLMLRQLGLHHSPAYDLAQKVPTAQIQLDPLQRFLFMADILIPRAVSTAGGHAALLHAHNRPLQSASDLSWLFGGGPYGPSPPDQFLQGFFSKSSIPTLEDLAFFFKTQWLKSYHFEIRPNITDPLETHYGPPHQEGEGLSGKILEFDLLAYSDIFTLNEARCTAEMFHLVDSWLCQTVSTESMKVDWDLDGLDQYGTVNPSGYVDHSHSRMSFTPFDERFPGMGNLQVVTGVAHARPHIAEQFSFLPLQLRNYLVGEFSNLPFPWKVSYHDAKGITFTVPAMTVASGPAGGAPCTVNTSCDGGALTTLSASTVHVCGSLESTTLAQSPEQGQTVQHYTGSSQVSTIPVNGYFSWLLHKDRTFRADGLYSHAHIAGHFEVTPNGVTAVIHLSGPTDPGSKVYNVSPQDVTVPVTSDPTCH